MLSHKSEQTNSQQPRWLPSCNLFWSRKINFSKSYKAFLKKSWPGLSENLVTKHLLYSTATAKGHLAQTRQHLQSMKNLPVNQNAYIEAIKKNIAQLKSYLHQI